MTWESAQDAKVILFVGRLNRDKGMLELAAAFDAIAKQHTDVELLLVGAEEDVPFQPHSGNLPHGTRAPALCELYRHA